MKKQVGLSASTNASPVLRLDTLRLSTICYILGIIWMYRIGCISYVISGFGIVWYLLGSLSLLLAVFVYVRGEAHLSNIHGAIFVFCVLLIIISLSSGTPTLVWLDDIFEILMLAVIMDIGLTCGGRRYLQTGFHISLIMISANTMSALIFPDALFRDASGAASVLLLGADNSMIVRYMLAILFELLYRSGKKGEFVFPAYGVINLALFSFMRDIATGKVMLFLFIVLLMAAKYIPGFHLSPATAVAFNGVFFIAVVLGQSAIGWADPVFQMLGRESDFTHRADLWAFSLNLISQNPLTGIGCFSDETFNWFIMTMTNLGLYNTGNPHNTYLTIALSGGLLSLASFASILFLACRQTRKRGGSLYLSILSIFLMAFMLHAQVEGRDTAYVVSMAMCIIAMESMPSNKVGGSRDA